MLDWMTTRTVPVTSQERRKHLSPLDHVRLKCAWSLRWLDMKRGDDEARAPKRHLYYCTTTLFT